MNDDAFPFVCREYAKIRIGNVDADAITKLWPLIEIELGTGASLDETVQEI